MKVGNVIYERYLEQLDARQELQELRKHLNEHILKQAVDPIYEQKVRAAQEELIRRATLRTSSEPELKIELFGMGSYFSGDISRQDYLETAPWYLNDYGSPMTCGCGLSEQGYRLGVMREPDGPLEFVCIDCEQRKPIDPNSPHGPMLSRRVVVWLKAPMNPARVPVL